MASFDFELLLFEQFPFALLDFEIEKTVRLSCPSDCLYIHLRHLHFSVLRYAGGLFAESATIFM